MSAMTVKSKLAFMLVALAAAQVTSVLAQGNETEIDQVLNTLEGCGRSIRYFSRILNYMSASVDRLKEDPGLPNYDVIHEKLQAVKMNTEDITEKVVAAIEGEGHKIVKHIKDLKTSSRQFGKNFRGLTSDLKTAAKTLRGRAKAQTIRNIKLLERGGKAFLERMKGLTPPDSRKTKKEMMTREDVTEEAEEARGTSSGTPNTTLNISYRSVQGSDPRLARQEVAVSSSSSRDARGRSLMDFDRMERYLDACPSCMVRTETYQCPLHGEALEMQKWAKALQDLVSFGCQIPEGCETNKKCCIYSDPEVRKSIASVTKTLQDLYGTFQKSCTKCNQKLKDEAQRDEWSGWGSWSSCDVTCGQNGRRQRERQCVRLPARERGDKCAGQAVQVARCPPMAACTRDEWSSWGSWSSCDVTCGQNGRRQRERQCIRFPARSRGDRCGGQAVQVARCPGVGPCEIRLPEWSNWSRWTSCSVTCGRGITYRSRTCQRSRTDSTRATGCQGEDRQRRECDSGKECCIDGNWASWESWGGCSTTCGRGQTVRRRRCSNPAPNSCGRPCPGTAVNTKTCNDDKKCCVNGNWSPWGSWSACSATCGRGQSVKRRRCNNPAPNECGRSCPGSAVASRVCGQDRECCVDGNWGSWLGWSACSVTCGLGTQSRIRRCDSPAPNFCGRRCDGPPFSKKQCDAGECCVDGNWSSWGSWGQCSVTCGTGRRRRERQCSNPSPNRCGRPCPGSASDVGSCSAGRPCEVCVDGNWGEWQRWSACSVSCGTGRRTRVRSCDNPPKSSCGKPCAGEGTQADSCYNSGTDGNWGQWAQWSTCSASCGQGERVRRRVCDSPAPDGCGFPCMGLDRDKELCNEKECCVDGNWSPWQSWSPCSVTCGRGERTRRRSCDSPRANYCGRQCPGPEVLSETCDSGRECCVDGNWGKWQAWSLCSATCGRGTRERRRSCDSPRANYCGRSCDGRETDTDYCDSGVKCEVCIDGNWGQWTAWSDCSATCGLSVRERTRQCDSPPATRCGRPCLGDDVQMKEERCGPPAIDGEWSKWTQWSPCSVTCGVGSMSRSRTCSAPPPTACGEPCTGITDDRQTCVGSSGTCECELKAWASWESWGSCSATCGYGVRSRSRTCAVLKEGIDCGYGRGSCARGDATEMEQCLQSTRCPGVDDPAPPANEASWSPWEAWCPCQCRTAARSRRRECQRSLSGSEVEKVSPNQCAGEGLQEKECTPEQHCPECITSCEGKPDGQYHTCDNCRLTVVCSGGQPEVFKECDEGLEWDAFSKRCVKPPSSSCMVHECCSSCADKPDGLYHDCFSCSAYVACSNGQARTLSCPNPEDEWNQIRQRCEPGPSPTCQRQFGQLDADLKGIIIGGAYRFPPNFSIHDRIATLYVKKAGTVVGPTNQKPPVVSQVYDRIATINGGSPSGASQPGNIRSQGRPSSGNPGSSSTGGGTPLGIVAGGGGANAGGRVPANQGQGQGQGWGVWHRSGLGRSSSGSSGSSSAAGSSSFSGSSARGGGGTVIYSTGSNSRTSSGGSNIRTSGGSIIRTSDGTIYRTQDGQIIRTSDGSNIPSSGGSIIRTSDGTIYRTQDGQIIRTSDGSNIPSSGGSIIRTSDGTIYRTQDGSNIRTSGGSTIRTASSGSSGSSSQSSGAGYSIGYGPGAGYSAGSSGSYSSGSYGSRSGSSTGTATSVSGSSHVPVRVLNVPDCVMDCKGAIPGKYPSCRGCEHYVICTRSGRLRQRKCLADRKWDDNLKKCAKVSTTCQ